MITNDFSHLFLLLLQLTLHHILLVCHCTQARAEDKSQLQLKKSSLDAITAMVARACNHGCDDGEFCPEPVPRAELVCLVRAQREVYRYLYDTHYRKVRALIGHV